MVAVLTVLPVVAGAAGTLPTAWATPGVGTPAVGGVQPDGPPAAETTIEVVSVSPWVAHDGTWSAQLRVTGAPPGATVRYTVFSAISGSEPTVRRALSETAASTDDLTMLHPPSTPVELAAVTAADGFTALDIPIRSRSGERDRLLIPDPGSFPVEVVVGDGAGAELASRTLYLNRLPATDTSKSPLLLGLLFQVHGEVAFDDEGVPALGDRTDDELETMLDLLDAAAGLRATVDLRPQIADALAGGDVADRQLLERVAAALEGTTVLGTPWAQLHVDGLAGSATAARRSLQDGQATLLVQLKAPTDTTVWPTDPSVGTDGVDLLRALGTSGLIVEPDQLTEDRAPGGESGWSRPFVIEGEASEVRAMSLDPALQDLLSSDATAGDPTWRAHRMLTQLFATWHLGDRGRGAVVRLDASVDAATARSMLTALAAASAAPGDAVVPVAVAPLSDVVALPPITTRVSGRDTEWTRQLTAPDRAVGTDAVADRVERLRPLLDDYTQILPPSDPAVVATSVLVRRSLDRRLDPRRQADVVDQQRRRMTDDLGRITATAPRTLTITSRRSAIPLRFQNDTGRPIQARLRLESPRLAFPDGGLRALTLEPGLNRLDVDVEVQASGQFVLQADLLAPRSDRVLASTRQRIRSGAFSGVGLMLSGSALLFLVIWWSRTLRRRARESRGEAPVA